MTPVFLDTSFILALEDADDQYHKEAIAFWRAFQKRPQPLVTTSYVFDETITLVRKRLDYDQARSVAKRLRFSPSVTLVHVRGFRGRLGVVRALSRQEVLFYRPCFLCRHEAFQIEGGAYLR